MCKRFAVELEDLPRASDQLCCCLVQVSSTAPLLHVAFSCEQFMPAKDRQYLIKLVEMALQQFFVQWHCVFTLHTGLQEQ